MYTFLIILFVLLSFSMVVVILLQAGKGQGLAGSIGGGMGGSSVFGGRGAADFLSKSTTWIAAAYMILAILIGFLYKSEAETTQKSLIQQRVEEQQSLPASNIPVAPIPETDQPSPNN
ncbi:MAG: preprotein translocase subunit SecG [Calditrichaceae bacterium]